MKNNSQLIHQVDAIIPSYNEQGDNTTHLIYYNKAKQKIVMRAERFLTQALSSLGISLSSRRQWADHQLEQRNLNPIVISPETLLIPIKMREAVSAKDGCYGHVKYQNIKSYTDDYLIMNSGHKIHYLSSKATLERRFRRADYLNLTYKKEIEAEYKAVQEAKAVTLPIDETSDAKNLFTLKQA